MGDQPFTDAERLPVTTAVHSAAHRGIHQYAASRGITFADAAEELIYAGIHLVAATSAGYRLPTTPTEEPADA